jgi:hypothetical protein
MQQQLFLFEINKEKSSQEIFDELDSKYQNLRKSQHARISGLNKEIKELKNELEFIKAKICKEGLFL